MKRALFTLFAIFTLTIAQTANSTPNVVVSVPSLHSLVSALMQGAGEPVLLLKKNFSNSSELDVFQKSRMITADMIIWAGAGYEKPIARAVDNAPALEEKLFTVSKYVPLLGIDNYDKFSTSRQFNHDLKFWSDPKLARMAVKMITPQLVRLDPEHTELYLDNEIALLENIQLLSKEIHAALLPYSDLSFTLIKSTDRYFHNRFMVSSRFAIHEESGFRKVSTNAKYTASCSPIEEQYSEISYGPDFYFRSMRQRAESVSICMRENMGSIKTARQLHENKRKAGVLIADNQ